ncbi:hypothetical protein Ciccas_009031 [Cichlidogyrus casuarinus]|uniref:Group XV phospholipase A2 n=1 Tax=Cichlidogyrus casuarinus TaxID=1844966 RepID=A0ABD2PY82_9PLAT
MNNDNLKVYVQNFGKLLSVEYIGIPPSAEFSYYAALSESIQKSSEFYFRDINLLGAPYDFRRAPNDNDGEFNTEMKKLIEDTYFKTGNRRVSIIGHSMGVCMMLSFFNKMPDWWKQRYIHSFMNAAAPLGGSVFWLKGLISGTDFGYPQLSPSSFRSAFQISTASYLLPSESVWLDNVVLVNDGTQSFTSKKYKDFMKSLGLDHC